MSWILSLTTWEWFNDDFPVILFQIENPLSKEGHAAKIFLDWHGSSHTKIVFSEAFLCRFFLPGSICAQGAHDIQCLPVEFFILIQSGSDAQQLFCVVVPGVKAADGICCNDGNKKCSIPYLKDIMEWINAGSALQWTGQKLIMNIAMINPCQRPISVSNGLERDSQQAQHEHVPGFYFPFLF